MVSGHYHYYYSYSTWPKLLPLQGLSPRCSPRLAQSAFSAQEAAGLTPRGRLKGWSFRGIDGGFNGIFIGTFDFMVISWDFSEIFWWLIRTLVGFGGDE